MATGVKITEVMTAKVSHVDPECSIDVVVAQMANEHISCVLVCEGDWPVGEAETHLSVNIGMLNTIILIMSSITMVMAWAALKMKSIGQARGWLAATLVLAIAFLVIKIGWEYGPKFEHGLVPSTSTFYAIYFTLTGLHGLHIVGGIVVIGYFLLPGSAMWKTDPERYTNRIECTGLYWHFVDLVWIFLFPTLYLL